jgi:hypothetical protein
LSLEDRQIRPVSRFRIAFAFVAVAPLAACAGGVDLGKAGIDDTLTTSAVGGETNQLRDATQTSDEVTIRNAVSSADLDVLGPTGLAWANSDTGSRGAITQLTQYDRKGLLCRKFKASRESFDGVRLYAGDACRAGDGSWRILEFVES